MSPNYSTGNFLPTFMLSPLNENDLEYENPLNKGMMFESTATGFLWSKRRDEQHSSVDCGMTPLLSTAEQEPHTHHHP